MTGDLILRLLRNIASSGTAIIVATHSAEAAAISDRVIHMRDGQIE
jgi:ABC-type lipoprotein export system ATPase subunit